ncbi:MULTISPECIES: SH3 domain-containing protein [Methylosinus]|uniref:SH3 domain-containing protein n=1 Tax=Methylosinus trichosporium (strain ATCC 35070 / NCIMB 11131 / UNIQEM 75 / OB3b) TaxID=595536 RepID=A0A2D2D103_METT3|nr:MULTISPECIES: hypothetical protein [Methylosinus]ATQ68675.1 hypothetical protein CQW49_12870 [Methylosinus trichosporium OB3b]OBS53161.1 hypothetical protein A8B73_07650 [Methylosinus sp. 3S-1]
MKSKLATLVAVALLAGAGSAIAGPRIVTDLAAFRSGPGVTFMPILAIPPKTVVEVRGHIGGWSRVVYAGNVGFVASSLLARPAIVAPVVAVPAPVVAVPAAIVTAPAPAPLF